MEIKRFGYYWLDTWVLANVIQLATQDFCARYLNHSNDPCGRQYDQMTQAARSAPANIAEGASRRSTSKETEMKLTDVARATLSELTNDFVNWLLRHESIPWSIHSADYKAVNGIRLDRPEYPTCPACGKPMLRRVAKKGLNSGREFWSCSDYPNCMGARPIV